jgi:hypothetical protein
MHRKHDNFIQEAGGIAAWAYRKTLRSGIPMPSRLPLPHRTPKACTQFMVNMVMQVIAQDSTLTVDEASEMVADTRKAALAMFPDKELAFDLIYWPRLQRLMRERYRMQ